MNEGTGHAERAELPETGGKAISSDDFTLSQAKALCAEHNRINNKRLCVPHLCYGDVSILGREMSLAAKSGWR